MKKIMFFATFVVAMMFAACGNKTVTSDDALGAAVDSVEVVESVDSLVCDADTVVVDSVSVTEF